MSENDKEGLTRREFIQHSARNVAAAVALSTYGATSFSRILPSDDSFEYIVVGSGAGGGPLACRLAAAGKRVLLLEAGNQKGSPYSEVPAFHPSSSEDPAISWNFFVEHYGDPERQQRDPKRVPGKGILYPRASTLGGCTAHHAMIALYPDNEDWDRMAQATGDSSWSAGHMRSYFERLENASYVHPIKRGLARHGSSGWLHLEQNDPQRLLQDRQLSAIGASALFSRDLPKELLDKLLLQLGNFEFDPNDWNNVVNRKDGLFNIPKSTRRGKRNGVRELIMNTLQSSHGNLHLKSQCLVTKILFDEKDPLKVIGVEYLEGAHLYRASPKAPLSSPQTAVKRVALATQEVILAGGAFNSPQLLMLSGIGPQEELERWNIPVRLNLPGVGRNLQDRYEVSVVTELTSDLDILGSCAFGMPGDPCLEDYKKNPATSLYSSNGVTLALLLRSQQSRSTQDLCLFGLPGDFRGYYPGYSYSSFDKGKYSWAILKGHTRNTSGYVRLRSKDPLDPPEINFKYFEEGNDSSEDDLLSVVKGVKEVRRIMKQWPAQSVSERELTPGPAVETDAQLREYVKDNAWGHHASCTNKMGPRSDALSVTDSQFRVHGTRGLRIVDASVFPSIPGLFIAVPTHMLAEKASDVILRGQP